MTVRAQAKAAGGGVVYLPRGQYYVDVAFLLRNKLIHELTDAVNFGVDCKGVVNSEYF